VIAILTPILGIYGSVYPFPPFPANIGVWCALVGIAISLIWTLSSSGRVPVGEAEEAEA
jgi:hypothetical protein